MNKMSEHVDAVVIITNQIGDMSDVSCFVFCVGMVEGMCFLVLKFWRCWLSEGIYHNITIKVELLASWIIGDLFENIIGKVLP